MTELIRRDRGTVRHRAPPPGRRLAPGDVLAFREAGRRRWYSAPIAKVFVTVAQWNVDAERAERRNNRRKPA